MHLPRQKPGFDKWAAIRMGWEGKEIKDFEWDCMMQGMSDAHVVHVAKGSVVEVEV